MKKVLTRSLSSVALAVLLIGTSAACGSVQPAAEASASETSSEPRNVYEPDTPTTTEEDITSPGINPANELNPRLPQVSGLVAAVGNNIAQVQGGGKQTAVIFDQASEVSQQVTSSLAELSVGTCVMVQTENHDEASDNTDVNAPAVAASVTILPSNDDNECGMPRSNFSAGDPARQRPEGIPSDRPQGDRNEPPNYLPSDFPTDRPTDGSGRRPDSEPGTFDMIIVGKVTQVSDSGFAVGQTGWNPAQMRSESSDSEVATATETDAQTERSVTVTVETRFQKNASVETSAVTTGLCLTATGEQDSAGTITAQTIALTDPVDGECVSTGVGLGLPDGGWRGMGAADARPTNEGRD